MPQRIPVPLLAALVLLLTALAGRAEVVVTIDHNDNAVADDEAFHFKAVPAPRPSAALGATFSLIDGNGDPQGSPLEVLHDGKVPGSDDEPEANFFFLPGTDGGRLLVDLGRVIAIKEVDTYSWHPDSRAPQVYTLYGSDGSGPGFAVKPQRPQDPALCGWQLLAKVDTRQKFGKAGGQYGVSVAAPVGAIGGCRYLLFDISQTEVADPFGNTFYSEIDVIDRDAPANSAPARAAKQTSSYDRNGWHLVFTNDCPTFDPKEQTRLVDTFFSVYPQMMATFNPDAPKSVKISIEQRYRGVAATAGTTIHINPDWFHTNPEDLDVITHEGMHVVQQYQQYDPVWLTEGIADYARYKFGVHNAAANWTLPDYSATQSYRDSYRVTARFLAWLDKHVKPGIVIKVDQVMRAGKYTPEFWQEQTGKSIDDLWQDYGKNPAL